eukprot:6194440-Pleurochrysis_carterae.AAC.2
MQVAHTSSHQRSHRVRVHLEALQGFDSYDARDARTPAASAGAPPLRSAPAAPSPRASRAAPPPVPHSACTVHYSYPCIVCTVRVATIMYRRHDWIAASGTCGSNG